MQQTTSIENRQPRRKCAAAPRPRQTGQYWTIGCRPFPAHTVQGEIAVPKQNLQDAYHRIEGPQRNIRAHGRS